MDLLSLAFFASALFVAAGSPGPSIAALVARVLARGHRDVWPFLAAMWIGEGIWLSCAVWGLAALAEAFQPAFVAVKWLGVAYLTWLAYRMWRAPVTKDGGALPAARTPWRMFAAGLAVTLGNPKIMVFYVALLPAMVDLHDMTVAHWASLLAVMAAVLIVVDFAWVVLAEQARRLLRSPAATRFANRLGAGMMAAAAAAIAVRS